MHKNILKTPFLSERVLFILQIYAQFWSEGGRLWPGPPHSWWVLEFHASENHIKLPTFVFLGRWDARELGVDFVVLWDLEHSGAVLDHPGQQVRPPRDLKDVLDVREIICRKDKQLKVTWDSKASDERVAHLEPACRSSPGSWTTPWRRWCCCFAPPGCPPCRLTWVAPSPRWLCFQRGRWAESCTPPWSEEKRIKDLQTKP